MVKQSYMIDWSLSDVTIQGHSEPGSDGYEELLHISQSLMTGAYCGVGGSLRTVSM